MSVCAALLVWCAPAVGQQTSPQVENTIERYLIIEARGRQLWATAQSVSPSSSFASLTVQREILDFTQQAFDFSSAIQLTVYSQMQTGAVPDQRLMLLARSLQAMITTLNSASDYLAQRHEAYLQVAKEHEQAWQVLRSAALLDRPQ
jgi:hypothetical protein